MANWQQHDSPRHSERRKLVNVWTQNTSHWHRLEIQNHTSLRLTHTVTNNHECHSGLQGATWTTPADHLFMHPWLVTSVLQELDLEECPHRTAPILSLIKARSARHLQRSWKKKSCTKNQTASPRLTLTQLQPPSLSRWENVFINRLLPNTTIDPPRKKKNWSPLRGW